LDYKYVETSAESKVNLKSLMALYLVALDNITVIDKLEARAAITAIMDCFTLSAELPYINIAVKGGREFMKSIKYWLYHNILEVWCINGFLTKSAIDVTCKSGGYTTTLYKRTAKLESALSRRYNILKEKKDESKC